VPTTAAAKRATAIRTAAAAAAATTTTTTTTTDNMDYTTICNKIDRSLTSNKIIYFILCHTLYV
jgi:hypothetical protein